MILGTNKDPLKTYPTVNPPWEFPKVATLQKIRIQKAPPFDHGFDLEQCRRISEFAEKANVSKATLLNRIAIESSVAEIELHQFTSYSEPQPGM